jgi:hypothetical protein
MKTIKTMILLGLVLQAFAVVVRAERPTLFIIGDSKFLLQDRRS